MLWQRMTAACHIYNTEGLQMHSMQLVLFSQRIGKFTDIHPLPYMLNGLAKNTGSVYGMMQLE